MAWILVALAWWSGCNGGEQTVRIDGSSTVYPITEAITEEFLNARPEIRVTVGFSGTGGGFKKLIGGQIDICDASRAIKATELEALATAKIEAIELQVAYDGLAVLVNPENTWCHSLTTEQLKEIWKPGSSIKKWSDLDAAWPDEPMSLYAPGTDSGTFDYFTEAIVGEAKSCRDDFTPSEDDNVLVHGISEDRFALGFFGLAYYAENQQKLKLLGIDSGQGPVEPSVTTVNDGSYEPLSRPLFLYVRSDALKRPEVASFIDFYLENAGEMAAEVGYVPVRAEAAEDNRERLTNAAQG